MDVDSSSSEFNRFLSCSIWNFMLYTARLKTTCERVSSFTRDMGSRRDREIARGIDRVKDSRFQKWTPLLGGGKWRWDKDGDSLMCEGRV